ncbi:MAG TPA: cyclic nucleotide-binding domain-containing protein [Acidimicrobiia bacterium]|nr:cyclic nucleotide-binding domain-containing protein [Acidimicrobiia bacterium]
MKADELGDRAELLTALSKKHLSLLASVAEEASYPPSEVIFREDQPADEFYIIEKGLVGLELATPGLEPLVILSLCPNELLGISWMFPPYRWQWTARAITGSQLLVFDAAQVRQWCEEDPDLKLWVLQMVAAQAVKRLHTTRVQLMDLYEAR